ncbi:hypothetical protein D9M68_852700 [compost metagenome]
MSSEARKAPESEPMPPTTTTTKITEPTVAAMLGSVTKVLPPITPASPARPVPAPNTSISTRGTLWPRLSTISGWVSAAWMIRPMRVRVSSSQSDTSISRATSIMKPRVAGNGEQITPAAEHTSLVAAPQTICRESSARCTSVKAGPRNASGGAKSSAVRPQTSCTTSSRM